MGDGDLSHVLGKYAFMSLNVAPLDPVLISIAGMDFSFPRMACDAFL
jgi:hypothetical protein